MDGELKEYKSKMNFKNAHPVSKDEGFDKRDKEGEQDEWSEAQLLTMTNESFSNDQKDEESSSQSFTRSSLS
jgi:hypothetical protein